jgi:(p)ppGpp synthase/HD superfamily hydrolase
MHSYAQTNVQLFNQLRSEGYSKKERQSVLAAYEFAMRLFPGLFLPSGKPFIDHLVGTASILASLRVPIEIVTAGLIHAAYRHGIFGGLNNGISEAKRREVRRAVGAVVEDYVARYDRLLWSEETAVASRDALDQLLPIDRDVFLIRLVNELEHVLDLGGLYYARSEKEQRWHQGDLERVGPILMEMSVRLGFPSLAAEMDRIFKITRTAEIPVAPPIQRNPQAVYMLAPQSYCERFYLISCRKIISGCRWSLSIARRARSKCGRSYHSMRKRLRSVFAPPA